MFALVETLMPVRRSITGNGVRETLEILAAEAPIEVHEVPSGTAVLDWEVPLEWNLHDAWIAREAGERVLDLDDSSLHVAGYSTPIRAHVSRAELEQHLHSLPQHPQWIPYRNFYYEQNWGFCLQHERREALADGRYEVCIDATLEPGSLTYGECELPGEVEDEVLLSTHVCHSALANDNLSAVVVAATLARLLHEGRPRHTFRILFAPGTIGAITWLARNRDRLDAVCAGLVLTCLGDGGGLTYKRSRRETAVVDRAAALVLQDLPGSQVRRFTPDGADERQFCSPGFDLPVGHLSRTPSGEYPESHTSADDLTLISPQALADSLAALRRIVAVVDRNAAPVATQPWGEPQLGRRGLLAGDASGGASREALSWVLNLADGAHDLLAMAERSGLPWEVVEAAAGRLRDAGLLEWAEQPPAHASVSLRP
jgi:aminopeptidase-like protein